MPRSKASLIAARALPAPPRSARRSRCSLAAIPPILAHRRGHSSQPAAAATDESAAGRPVPDDHAILPARRCPSSPELRSFQVAAEIVD
jgi:hypothetical protein